MKKEKLPDGFPVENEQCKDLEEYPCDNCGKIYNYYGEGAITAASETEGGDEENCHCYGFCSEKCFKEFEQDNGLIAVESNDGQVDYNFLLYDDQETPNAEPDSEQTPKPEATEVEMFEPEEPTCYEKKATECWKHVVKTAQEISQAASNIVVLQDRLKEAKKEYDALVNRQNSYILTNGDSIQTTFADMDKSDQKEEDSTTADGELEVVDTMAWRDEPVTTLKNYGLTDKQADKAQEAFGTLGRLQDWLCADYRDKQPGIGQALQDKLTEALNKYTETVYANAKNDSSNDETPDAEEEAETEPEETDKEE